MNSSAVDARLVIATEKLLDDGAVIYSCKDSESGKYLVRISLPKVLETLGVTLVELAESDCYDGSGSTFTQAFNNAYNQVPERTSVAA